MKRPIRLTWKNCQTKKNKADFVRTMCSMLFLICSKKQFYNYFSWSWDLCVIVIIMKKKPADCALSMWPVMRFFIDWNRLFHNVCSQSNVLLTKNIQTESLFSCFFNKKKTNSWRLYVFLKERRDLSICLLLVLLKKKSPHCILIRS